MAEPVERTCYRHPDRATGLSCSECGRPICTECMTMAPVGIRCPEHSGKPQGVQRMTQAEPGARAFEGTGAKATKALIGINVAVYIAELAQGGGVYGAAQHHLREGLPLCAVRRTRRLVAAGDGGVPALRARSPPPEHARPLLVRVAPRATDRLGPLPADLSRLGPRGIGRRARPQPHDARPSARPVRSSGSSAPGSFSNGSGTTSSAAARWGSSSRISSSRSRGAGTSRSADISAGSSAEPLRCSC